MEGGTIRDCWGVIRKDANTHIHKELKDWTISDAMKNDMRRGRKNQIAGKREFNIIRTGD